MGLGLPLAELMEASAWEAFLSPFSLALRAAASGEAPAGAAPEVPVSYTHLDVYKRQG